MSRHDISQGNKIYEVVYGPASVVRAPAYLRRSISDCRMHVSTSSDLPMTDAPEPVKATGDIYTALGTSPVINAASTLTKLGGSLMPEQVVRAMADAAENFVDISELAEIVGRRIATLTRNDAAHVTSGCAAAIALSVLASTTRGMPELVVRPPGPAGRPVEVIVDRSHNPVYLPAIELGGGRIVYIGSPSGTTPRELREAISLRTAAVFYVTNPRLAGAALPLAQTIEIAHSGGVPVIVDAANQLPPKHNLWKYTTEMGAELALFSGGKELRGPQSSGLIVGRADYVAACVANASPNTGLARAMKAGKEEIVGLLKAIEIYVESDQDSVNERRHGICARWVTELGRVRGVTPTAFDTNSAGQPTPRVMIELDAARTGIDAIEMERRLWASDPRIAVLAESPTSFYITPDTLEEGEADVVAEAIAEILDGTRTGRNTTHIP